MTTHLSSMSEPHHAAARSGPSAGRGAPDSGPYAQPAPALAGHAVDAVLIDAIRATVGPYVPTPWRTRPADSIGAATTTTFTTAAFAAASPVPAAPDQLLDIEPVFTSLDDSVDQSTALPWIDAFLDGEEDEADDAAAEEAAGVVAARLTESEPQEASVPESSVESSVESSAEAVAPDSADDWPFDEAGAAMRELADDLITHEADAHGHREATPQNAAPQPSTPPLQMWGDDDLMDIMPTKSARPVADNGEHWAARARRETERAGNPEAAAQALESLARRVRDGEIVLPGYSHDMGDAAALAAALAALLGVRR